jgi:hypothetical protein
MDTKRVTFNPMVDVRYIPPRNQSQVVIIDFGQLFIFLVFIIVIITSSIPFKGSEKCRAKLDQTT